MDKFISRIFGAIAGFEFFSFLQNFINQTYVNYFKIDLSEFQDAKEYKSLTALFTRALQKPRDLEQGFISPCDGKILECGKSFVGEGTNLAFSVKGFTYDIDELLQNAYEKKELEKGVSYVNIYLSPRDYHRYHAPCDLQILSATYTSGKLLSVSEANVKKYANLYAKNERVVLKCLSADKSLFWLVFVGALNVGKMCFEFDKSIQTNAPHAHNFTHTYENLKLKKGEELGHFELGSTILILASKLEFKQDLIQKSVKFGQNIAEL